MPENTKDEALNNKWFILIVTLILGIILFSFMARVISKTTYKSSSPKTPFTAQVKVPTSQFTDGSDWNMLDAINVPPLDKVQLKLELVKLAFDSSLLSGKPLITSSAPLQTYVQDLDLFYRDTANSSIPLFFAIRIMDMKKNGTPEISIQGYKQVLTQKLIKMGIIKK